MRGALQVGAVDRANEQAKERALSRTLLREVVYLLATLTVYFGISCIVLCPVYGWSANEAICMANCWGLKPRAIHSFSLHADSAITCPVLAPCTHSPGI